MVLRKGVGIGKLRKWRRSAGGMPIAGSRSRCALWSIRESLPEFCYVFFCLAWPVPVLQTSMASTSSSDWQDLLLGNGSLLSWGWVYSSERGELRNVTGRQWNGSLGTKSREWGSSSARQVTHLFWLVCPAPDYCCWDSNLFLINVISQQHAIAIDCCRKVKTLTSKSKLAFIEYLIGKKVNLSLSSSS